MSAKRFAAIDAAWARVAMKLDLAETKAAVTLGALPAPAADIPASKAARIAEDVTLLLAGIAVEQRFRP